MGAARHHGCVEEVLADLAPQRGLEGRERGERRRQPVCAVRDGSRGGLEGQHIV